MHLLFTRCNKPRFELKIWPMVDDGTINVFLESLLHDRYASKTCEELNMSLIELKHLKNY